MLKEYLLEAKNAKDYKYKSRIISALKATLAIHPHYFEGALKEKLSEIARRVEDKDLMSLVYLLSSYPGAWNHLENDVAQKLINYVRNLPSDKIDELDVLLVVKPLKESAEYRIKRITIKELADEVFFGIPEQVGDQLVSMYLGSPSFDYANRVAKEMIRYADDFSGDQIRRVLMKANENDQVTGSFELGALFNAFRKYKTVPSQEFEALLAAHGLDEYVEFIDDEQVE